MNLQDALRAAADYLHLNGDELVRYAEETPDFGEHMQYGGMSIDREEGQFLYSLVRALQPERALEIGMYEGVSATHILEGMYANHAGELVSIDIRPHAENVDGARWTVLQGDATTAALPAADFVYEDSAHELAAAELILANVRALNPRVVVSHDYYSDVLYGNPEGFAVRQAFEGVFGADAVQGIQWDGGMRGFGLWLNPEWEAPEPVVTKPAQQKPAPRKRPPATKATAKK